MTLIPPAHTPAAKIAIDSIIGGRSISAEMLVEEGYDTVDRAVLGVIDLDRAVLVGDREDVPVQRVVPGDPRGVLPAGLEQVVAEAEDALEMVVVTAHHQDRQRDRLDALQCERLVDP